jgi:hypothetical protein
MKLETKGRASDAKVCVEPQYMPLGTDRWKGRDTTVGEVCDRLVHRVARSSVQSPH